MSQKRGSQHEDRSGLLGVPYPPTTLRQYALIADGCRGAVIGPRGDVVWLCAPRWDSPAVLSHLIGGDGLYAVTPTDPHVWGGYYEPGTLIWRSRWVTHHTIASCREALAWPGDPHRLVLLRQICAGDQPVRLSVLLRLVGDFGKTVMQRPHRDDEGRWTAQVGDLSVRWTGATEARWAGSGWSLEVRVDAEQRHDLVLEISDQPLPDPPDPGALWSATEHGWSEMVPELSETASPRDAQHAYAVLRGLTTPDGGMVAAATLGLPERAEAGKNYDYRYVWVRDQTYAGLACGVGEPYPLLDDAITFLSARLLEHGDQLVPAYRVDGSAVPKQHKLDLPGYPGGSDVVGNWVRRQFQLDAPGEALQLFAAAARHDRLTSDAARATDVAVEIIKRRWTEPDAGIWELHDAWWTQSRLACIAGLRAIAAVLPAGRGAELVSLADVILAETSRRCQAPDSYWQRSPDLAGVDASLLLGPVRGALPADDPRSLATLQQVEHDLVSDGHAYRYHADAQPLGQAEGSFTLCGFMLSLAFLQQGDRVKAFRYFDIHRNVCGPPGLLTEEYDVQQRQLRGNLPQAFVHAMLLEAAQRLGSGDGVVRRLI